MSKKVAIGLSGGIDSSVSAYLLVEQGYDVVGFTLKFSPQENRCCDLDSLYQAQRLCDKLNIPHYTLDAGLVFKREIIDYFIQSYLNALTPNPCSYCNRLIKFGYFFEKIKGLGLDYLATGHYVGLRKINDSLVFKKNKDKNKTQEYFLSLVEPGVLASLIFPLADYSKDQVKKMAHDKKILFKPRKESQDVCFVNDKTYPEFIEETYKDSLSGEGFFKHIDGKVLGSHKGLHHYTYGQRSGLGISWSEPLYVINMDVKNNEVTVGEKKHLAKKAFSVHSLNWFCDFRSFNNISVKVRYNSPEIACSLLSKDDSIEVKLKGEVLGLAPGQVAAFYAQDIVIGAGIIDKTFYV
jgi:tRNA-uridine 2-sulfurtransferase